MTPFQVLAVAALGGLAALVAVVLFIALALGLYQVIDRIIDLRAQHRARRALRRQQRADLAACHAINSLPARQPTDD
ncbi:hypothetical protein [Streptomyces sp. NPDC048584]|uniref:hypothetical protein n=1 Tax=Streptomyces sp. NPDC048584 TaxID=3365573 RepID=UPI003714E403